MSSTLATLIARHGIDVDSGDHIPTARIRRIEPLGPVGEVPITVRDMVQAAVEKRTGRRAIPFESGSVDEGYDPDQAALDDETEA